MFHRREEHVSNRNEKNEDRARWASSACSSDQGTGMRDTWLLFLPQTPAIPSSLRVLVWRRLQQVGAANLQSGAWMLPHTPEHQQTLEQLLTEMEQQGGGGFFLEAVAPSARIQAELMARFQEERNKEYQEFGERCQQFLQELEKETCAHKFTFAELEENEQDFMKLTRWLRKIQRRDFFPTPASQQAIEALARCRQHLHAFTTAVYEREGLPPQSLEDALHELPEQEA